jgi:hypothetical protein
MLRWRAGVWGNAGCWLALLVLYFSAYVALLNPQKMGFCSLGSTGSPWWRIPNYRWNSRVIDHLFSPANRVDRMLRPKYWVGIDPSQGFQPDPHPAIGFGGFGGHQGRGGFGGSIPAEG